MLHQLEVAIISEIDFVDVGYSYKPNPAISGRMSISMTLPYNEIIDIDFEVSVHVKSEDQVYLQVIAIDESGNELPSALYEMYLHE